MCLTLQYHVINVQLLLLYQNKGHSHTYCQQMKECSPILHTFLLITFTSLVSFYFYFPCSILFYWLNAAFCIVLCSICMFFKVRNRSLFKGMCSDSQSVKCTNPSHSQGQFQRAQAICVLLQNCKVWVSKCTLYSI